MSQRWPGWPWAGFMPGATAVGGAVAVGATVPDVGGGTVTVVLRRGAVVAAVAPLAAGLLSKGAPTAISQRWPGWPWGGFMPGAVVTTLVCGAGAEVGAETAERSTVLDAGLDAGLMAGEAAMSGAGVGAAVGAVADSLEVDSAGVAVEETGASLWQAKPVSTKKRAE